MNILQSKFYAMLLHLAVRYTP